MRQVLVIITVLSVLLSLGAGPASQPSQGTRARQKWEAAVLVFGDETTGEWSLRMRDKDVDESHQFHFEELWTYDRGKKQWVKFPSKPSDTVIAPPAQKTEDSEPNQVLVELPIDPDKVGLFYARWRIDEVDGATFFRLGPGPTDRSVPREKPQPGQMRAQVPVDKQHSVAELIPDPRVACEKDVKR